MGKEYKIMEARVKRRRPNWLRMAAMLGVAYASVYLWKESQRTRTTTLLGVRRRVDAGKKKGLAARKMDDAVALMVEEARALVAVSRAEMLADGVAEAHAYDISIEGVLCHLDQVDEIVCDVDFHMRCAELLVRDPPAREVYAALKHMKDTLVVFLRRQCYGHNK